MINDFMQDPKPTVRGYANLLHSKHMRFGRSKVG